MLWEKRYNGPANNHDSPTAVAVDAAGDVIVTGRSATTNNGEICTVKYSGADGTQLWEQRYHGPGTANNSGEAVAIDSGGNVIVTGISYVDTADFTNSYSTYYTAKYRSEDGALLWETNSSPPAGHHDQASAVVVDLHDDVIVTGTSRDPFTFDDTPNYADYYTVKYSGTNGATLWEARYNGPADGDDYVGAHSLAVGPEGTVAVAGASDGEFGPGFTYDYLTIAYRELPNLICPDTIVTNATAIEGIVVPFTVTATDGSGIPPTVVCVPAGGSQFPVGQTIVTCTATNADMLTNTCSFAVQVLVARSAKEKILAELITLRASTANAHDRRAIDKAVGYLDKSLAVGFWVDETHLKTAYGRRVFHWEGLTVAKLCNLIKGNKSGLPEATLQDLINRIFAVDRLLASVAIQDAIAEGEPQKRIEAAQKNLAKGDAAVGDSKCSNGIDHYRDAWKKTR